MHFGFKRRSFTSIVSARVVFWESDLYFHLITRIGPLCADPFCIKKMIDGEIQTLPSYEKTLSLGPWILSPSSPVTIIQAINAFGAMAWFYQQIKQMAKGNMPNLKQKLFNAFRADSKADKLAIKDYLEN